MNQYRQGDVFLEQIEDFPEGLEPCKANDGEDIVLAWGEVTGHAHRISSSDCVSYFSYHDNHNLMVVKKSPVALRHEEHRTIQIPPGVYVVRRQREYVPGELPRMVAD